MNDQEAERAIRHQIAVTRQQVTLAKAFLMRLPGDGPYDTLTLPSEFARQQGFEKPQMVILQSSANPEPQLRVAAGYLSCAVAMCEALWSLVYQGYFFPEDGTANWDAHLSGTTGSSNGGWRFEDLDAAIPSRVALAPSYRYQRPELLTDPDLFTLEAGVSGAHADVVEALQDAVRCFRADLYRPAVVMLGKALEGAWIEVGCALAQVVLPAGDAAGKCAWFVENTDFAKKIDDATRLYDAQAANPVRDQSGVKSPALREIAGWSHAMREARNAIHFGTSAPLPYNYDSLVSVLIAARRAVRLLYDVKRAAERHVTPATP